MTVTIYKAAEPTTVQLLDGIARRLLQGSGEFNYKWEMARHRCYLQVSQLLSTARLVEQMETQRAALAHLNRH